MSYGWNDAMREIIHEKVLDAMRGDRFFDAYFDYDTTGDNGDFVQAIDDLEDDVIEDVRCLIEGIEKRVWKVESEYEDEMDFHEDAYIKESDA